MQIPGDHVPTLTPGGLEVCSGCWGSWPFQHGLLSSEAPPPISGTLSETPSGRLILRPHPGGRAHSQGLHLCPGPDVSLQQNCIDFSWVNLREHSEQPLWIENKSDCTAYFQFAIDCQESVFSIRPAFGTLVGKARMTLHCTFRPTHPVIYFRRVACLVHHQVSEDSAGCSPPVFWNFWGCLLGSSPPGPQSGFWSHSMARGT